MPVVTRCLQCAHERRLTDQEMLDLLQDRGMLRRATKPEFDLLRELLQSITAELPCDQCDQRGLQLQDDWKDDWDDAVRCEGCKTAIPAERLEVFPDTKFCPSCQTKMESGERPGEEAEYCLRCGGLMQLSKRTGSGTAGYRMTCSSCGKSA